MNKNGKNKLVPELRFPEFLKAGEWLRTTIGEVGTFYYGKSAPKWSLSIDAPTFCVRYGELYTKFDTIISEISSRTNIDQSNLRFSKGGEILIPRVGEVPQDFARHCCYLPFPNIAIGEMISVYETEEYPIFYAYYFRTMWKQFAEVVEGQNVKNLYYVNLEPIVVGKPSFLEQQKIADCLSSLDDVITVENQKLETIQLHKKGLMQQVFPAEGEKVPKLRFKEFRNSGEWEEKALDETAIFLKGKGISKSDITTDGAQPCIRYGELYTHYKEIIKEVLSSTNLSPEQLILSETKDIIIPSSGETRKDIATASCVMKPGIALGGDLNILRSELDGIFLAYYLTHAKKIEISKLAQGDAVVHLYISQLKKLMINFPKRKEEQNKIGEALSLIDDLIITQSQKLEALKVHKKGLMQQLFPNVIEE
jgi:type I restriction enzyme, S subunit